MNICKTSIATALVTLFLTPNAMGSETCQWGDPIDCSDEGQYSAPLKTGYYKPLIIAFGTTSPVEQKPREAFMSPHHVKTPFKWLANDKENGDENEGVLIPFLSPSKPKAATRLAFTDLKNNSPKSSAKKRKKPKVPEAVTSVSSPAPQLYLENKFVEMGDESASAIKRRKNESPSSHTMLRTISFHPKRVEDQEFVSDLNAFAAKLDTEKK